MAILQFFLAYSTITMTVLIYTLYSQLDGLFDNNLFILLPAKGL